jgi:hypothetical protein
MATAAALATSCSFAAAGTHQHPKTDSASESQDGRATIRFAPGECKVPSLAWRPSGHLLTHKLAACVVLLVVAVVVVHDAIMPLCARAHTRLVAAANKQTTKLTSHNSRSSSPCCCCCRCRCRCCRRRCCCRHRRSWQTQKTT